MSPRRKGNTDRSVERRHSAPMDRTDGAPAPAKPADAIQTGRFEAFSGPLPHPDHFAAYERTLPGAADRVLVLAEKQTAHRLRQEARDLESYVEARRRAQWFAFLIALVSLGLGGYLIASGHSITAGFVLFVGLAELAIAIYAKLRQLLTPPGASGGRVDDAPPGFPDARRSKPGSTG